MYKLLFISLLSAIVCSGISAQKRIYNTSKITTDPPRIDGIFDDDAWDIVEWGGDFTQLQPYENRPPSQKTEFKIVYDDNNLYVALRCFDTSPDSIVRRMSRRDGFEGDWVEINIDSYHDLRSGFSFTVSASGVKGDEAISDDNNFDASWDPIWYVKTSIDALGWIAEMRIPFTQLRFSKQDEYVWGLQVNRRLYRKNERSSWQFISPKIHGWVYHFGELHGIKNISPKKQKDIVPYTVGRFEHYKKEEGNPFADGKDLFGTMGVDGKIGITNDLTLDFTVNPDFGQVEADPSEVNLTTFETKFGEKRPFFIEGNSILDYILTYGGGNLSSDNLFYSRRIGKAPSRSLDLEDDEYMKSPPNTTILGAFKLTGKTRKGWSIGVIESVTSREKAKIDSVGDRREEEVEPFTNYFASRIQKDFNNANTRIGAMITATNRDLSEIELANTMHRSAYSGGIDFNHQWKNKTYYFNISAAFSDVRGTEEAIYETQTNSPHFFQREDAKHLKVDSTLKHITGMSGNINIGRSSNGKWSYTLWLTWRSPCFNVNDIGYCRSNDEIQEVAWVGFVQNEPVSIFRNFNFNVNQWSGFTFGAEKRYTGGNFNAHCTFKNFWNIGGGITVNGESLGTEALRGGPALLNDGSIEMNGYINSDHRKKLMLFFNYYTYFIEHKISVYEYYNFSARFQVSDACSFSLGPVFEKMKNKIEYVDNIDYLDNTRYIRGNIDRVQASMVVRLNYNLTPDFTIQYYGMPFISARKYNDIKYIKDSKADDFNERYSLYTDDQITLNSNDNIYEIDEDVNGTVDYTFDNPNCNAYDFNSNLVLRWEYRPGSVLYLVWSENRSDSQASGNFSFGNDVKELFKIYPYDIFLIKLSYRFGL
jgi:hypothetical protein